MAASRATSKKPRPTPQGPRTREVVLQVTDLNHAFGDHQLLRNVELTLRAGEAVAVVGPNGAGKTTLLRCITGDLRFDTGAVNLLGRPLAEADATARAAMACVLDDIDFFPDLSAVEHLDLLARAHGASEEAAEELVDAVLAELEIVHVAGNLPSTLSSGQRRRLALASALVRPRRLLVLDEPEQRLDVAGVAWLGERLLAEKAAGTAVLMVSHDPDLVARVCDRTLRLEAATARSVE